MGPNMPVSCENSETVISSSIRESLQHHGSYNNSSNSVTKATNLGLTKNQLSTALKQSLLKSIEYVESPPGFGYSIQDTLRAKYTVLRPLDEEKSTAQSVGSSSPQLPKTGHGTKVGGACLPSPKLILYPREKVQIGWGNGKKWSVGSGMVNLGNTCYLNSTLQALFHVPSFANWLHSDIDHRSRCEELNGSQNGCIICSMADVLQSTQSSMSPTKPIQVYSKLKQICRHLVHGHQEDAHEFLRYLMESMEKAYLSRYKNSKEYEQYTKETTPINQILGGYLRTSVKCLSCQYESVTFQHFEDLLLDIRKVNTIEDALKYHFARERLEDMDYTCESCKKKVSATKQFSLERAPVALCIQLKRFSGINGKISKHINISQDIDFSQYSSRDVKNSQLKYRLVSMITHLGSTPQCGHYTAIGCSQDGSYYQFDDTSVRPMSVNSLLGTNPYIIFYELVPTKQSTTITSMTHNENNKRTETSTQFIGPLLPVATNQLNTPILSPNNYCAMKPLHGSTNNGFGDNRKLVTVSSNQMKSPKKIIDIGTRPVKNSINLNRDFLLSSNVTVTKNIDNTSTKLSERQSTSPPPPRIKFSLLPIKEQSPPKRTETTNKLANETTTKQSEDSRNSSSDSDSEIPQTTTVALLPSMPELKSNSPTAHKMVEVTKTSNGIQSTVTDDCRSNGKRLLDCENSSSPKGTVSVVNSPMKLNGPIVPKMEESKKLEQPSYNRVTTNPFSRVNNNSTKNVKHKTNGYSHHGSYNQRNPKSTNGYGTNGTNGSNGSSVRKSLVPYEDSDSNNEDRKSPPIVKTKAGPFQVTKNTTNGSNNHWSSGEQRLSWSNSSTGGRVPSLSTWSGGTSFLEDEIVNEQREHNKRKMEKDFDADLDAGRMKKKRRLGHNTDRDNPNYNAFQEHQNRNQRDSHRYRRLGNSFPFRSASYRFYHKNDYKSYNKRKYN